jgi:hypothetical protein
MYCRGCWPWGAKRETSLCFFLAALKKQLRKPTISGSCLGIGPFAKMTKQTNKKTSKIILKMVRGTDF